MARIGLGMTNAELAEQANVGVNTLSRFEQGSDARKSSLEAIQRVLVGAGATFLRDGEVSLTGGPGVRIRLAVPSDV